MDGILDGRCVVLTGASRGIGKAIATLFVENGARLVTVARSVGVQAEPGGPVIAIAGSVSDPETAQRCLAATDALGGCDILINAAGVFPTATLAEIDDAHAASVMDTNFHGVLNFCRTFVPDMARRGGGCVVNVTSLAARAPVPGMSVYAASKAAVEAFSRSIAVEYARNVRINCLAPGPTWTETVEQLAASDTTGAVEQVVGMIPMGRYGEAAEIADAALYLATGKGAAFMTGQSLQVNGGALMA